MAPSLPAPSLVACSGNRLRSALLNDPGTSPCLDMDVLILAGLILLNGVFAMSEIALITSKRAKLQKAADSGDTSARVALELGSDPNRFLSTVQVGITSIGVLSGVVGESALAVPLAHWLQGMGGRVRSSLR